MITQTEICFDRINFEHFKWCLNLRCRDKWSNTFYFSLQILTLDNVLKESSKEGCWNMYLDLAKEPQTVVHVFHFTFSFYNRKTCTWVESPRNNLHWLLNVFGLLMDWFFVRVKIYPARENAPGCQVDCRLLGLFPRMRINNSRASIVLLSLYDWR